MIIFNLDCDIHEEKKIKTTTSNYRVWLKSHGDTIRIRNERKEDPDDPSNGYYFPAIEVYKDNNLTSFHAIKANPQEQTSLGHWLKQYHMDSEGFIRIITASGI